MNKALPMQLNEFVDEDKTRQIVEDMLKIAKKMGASQGEVSFMSAVGLNVTVRLNEVETLEFNRDKGVGITVYTDQRKGSASTTDIKMESLTATVKAAIDLAKLTEKDSYAGLAESEKMAWEAKGLDLYHPWNLGVEEAIEIAKNCEKHALSFDKRIHNSEGATLSSTQAYHIYGNSHGFSGFYPATRHSLSCTVIAQDLQGMVRDYEFTVSRKESLLEQSEIIGKKAAEKTLSRLMAKKLPTQRIPILFHASIASSLISHLIAGLSGGRLFRRSSFLLESLNTKIFQDFMHIYEVPHICGGLGSAPFDSDGVATFSKDIVKEGIIQNYILSTYSARKLGLATTANAGGVHNLFVKSGNEDFQGLLKMMGRGLVVTELMGPGVNLVTGDYSRGASGFWVENGEIQYPVHEVTIAGNLLNMFKQIVAVGNDVDTRGTMQTGSLLIEEMTLAGI